MRWFVLAITALLTIVGLYFSAFNIWLTGTPIADPQTQAKHAGNVVALTVGVFVAGIAAFVWLTVRERRKNSRSKERPTASEDRQ